MINPEIPVNVPSQMQVSIEKIGREQMDAIVVDRFFSNPNLVRDHALGLEFEAPDYPYPGLIAKPDWDFSAIAKLVSRMLGISADSSKFVFRFSMVTRSEDDLLPCQTIPHIDPVQVAGLIYLTPPDQCFGGTAFYRHVATGAETLPANPGPEYLAMIKKHGFSDVSSWAEYLLTAPEEKPSFTSDSTENWTMTKLVEMKFNRMLIYNGKVFHSGYISDGAFGLKKEQRRLTLNFFVE